MQTLKHAIWAGLNLSKEKHYRDKEQVEKNSHVRTKPAEKKYFRCFGAIEHTEKHNSTLLTEMYLQFKATLLRNVLANHIWPLYMKDVLPPVTETLRDHLVCSETVNLTSFLLWK